VREQRSLKRPHATAYIAASDTLARHPTQRRSCNMRPLAYELLKKALPGLSLGMLGHESERAHP
jgi:hypothetical protein